MFQLKHISLNFVFPLVPVRLELLRDRRGGDGGRAAVRPHDRGVQGALRHPHHAPPQGECTLSMVHMGQAKG